METPGVMGVLLGGWENETCLVKSWGKSETELELEYKIPHFHWTVFIYLVLATEDTGRSAKAEAAELVTVTDTTIASIQAWG